MSQYSALKVHKKNIQNIKNKVFETLAGYFGTKLRIYIYLIICVYLCRSPMEIYMQ